MMESQIKTHTFPDGTIQRFQTVRLPDWEGLSFLNLKGSGNPLDCFAGIFRRYLIPACPWLFGHLVLFSLPEDAAVPFSRDTRYGSVADDLTAAAAGLRRGLRIQNGKPKFSDPETADFWHRLEEQNRIRIISGKLPITTIIPVGNAPGLLTGTRPEAELKVNASFFIMDPFDCATVFDHVGTCLGLMVKDGVITSPPLYGREALLVRKDGAVTVEPMDIRDLPIQIGAHVYRHGQNCQVYTRPRFPYVTGTGVKLVIVGSKMAAVCRAAAPIPASGFVLCPQGDWDARPGDPVRYPALSDVAFGIQVGNSILKDGVKTDTFRSKFYNIRHLQPVPYPPSLYPMDFRGSRAARIALGADMDGKPMLLWAEGAPKAGYVPGKHSRGASLADLGDFCEAAGMIQAVNLDGGGSAQLLLGNRRDLEISDRTEEGIESERYVPNGLIY